MRNVPVMFEDETVKGVEGEETGLDLHLLPSADHIALVVETSQHQHLPHQSQTGDHLGRNIENISWEVIIFSTLNPYLDQILF